MGTKKIKTAGGIGAYKFHHLKRKNTKVKLDPKRLPKGFTGEQKWFMTRNDAMRKLQLTPEEFQRITIYKGVHPREPKKKFGKPTDTYYHSKDIDYLKNDPIISTMREMKIFDRKLAKYIHRKEFLRAENYRNWSEPYFNLARLVKERYPSFEDAVKDSLDDCLSTLCLIAGLTADEHTGIKGKLITEAQTLIDQFYWLISKKNLVTKGFISAKGFYMSVPIAGSEVTWLQPFNFGHDTSEIVDFSPMEHFGDFYLVLLKFVNYRLYHEHGFVYPPSVDQDAKDTGLRWLSITADEKDTTSMDDEEDSSDNEEDLDKVDEEDEIEHQKVTPLKGVKVFINREVSLQVFALVLKSMGAEVGWQESAMAVTKYSPIAMDDPAITYHIYDRPQLPQNANSEAFRARSFIQPQWVFDSLNKGSIASLEDYEIGKTLPVHLSPWFEYVSPEEKEAIEKAEAELENTEERKLRKSMMTSTNRWMYDLKDRKKRLE